MGNIVAIVGRPNVGKSTLFNRLTTSRSAIVDEASGVTRDRHYGKVDWNGKEFSLIDTGGYIKGSDDIFEDEIRKQVLIAIEECDLIIFVVDVEVGVTDLDTEVANLLRRSNKKVILVSNKVDNNERIIDSHAFYGLAIGDEIFSVSAISGSGTGDLLDEVVKHIDDNPIEEEESDVPKIAIVGRPNVGKSSLLNTLIGKEKNIVTNIAGTTRDSLTTRFNSFGFEFDLVDTAGIRKKGKVNEDIEFYSVMRSIRAIENADVCLLMIEASEGVMAQDMNIYNLIIKNKKGVVVLVNKWDLIEKETNTSKEFEAKIKHKLAPFTDVPILFISAINKQRVIRALEEATKVYENRVRKISTSKLNEVMLDIINQSPPPSVKGKWIKIKFVTQLPTYSPAFAFFCNLPQYVKDSYKRFLENKLRENFDFKGVPIQIFMRKK
ncbi:MAG: ribosome biogenesis GTPase Der [Flavobacteriales bacterium]|nr:ribosome biogenesis GTPase Der [Flavobacteriales bacterium]MCW8913913.1 ribosome biogenesis GTPase Der [Flavobacteriales bacterium]MCW8938913.1 ribosome biogenesis GTPase Der [Flavobacteriales bacterium]MCW8940789.1 ribosome biogenesis GTPase Der [Flavobacteriales bacterium]MCW8991324.1 ribosome biogenesis GTPase Der [Flavobacteriales bacterium]